MSETAEAPPKDVAALCERIEKADGDLGAIVCWFADLAGGPAAFAQIAEAMARRAARGSDVALPAKVEVMANAIRYMVADIGAPAPPPEDASFVRADDVTPPPADQPKTPRDAVRAVLESYRPRVLDGDAGQKIAEELIAQERAQGPEVATAGMIGRFAMAATVAKTVGFTALDIAHFAYIAARFVGARAQTEEVAASSEQPPPPEGYASLHEAMVTVIGEPYTRFVAAKRADLRQAASQSDTAPNELPPDVLDLFHQSTSVLYLAQLCATEGTARAPYELVTLFANMLLIPVDDAGSGLVMSSGYNLHDQLRDDGMEPLRAAVAELLHAAVHDVIDLTEGRPLREEMPAAKA